MEILYEKYQNVLLCLGPKYRNWILLDKELNNNDFEKKMTNDKYVLHLSFDQHDNKFVYVVLFHQFSPYLAKTETFRKFLSLLINKYHKNDMVEKKKFLQKHFTNTSNDQSINKIMMYEKNHIETMFITKKELSTYFIRNIQTENKKINLIVHNYLHKRFLLEITNGPLCGKHTVLTKQEARELCAEHLMTSKFKLPFILITDPQIIWCGAKIGDIVKIEINSELAGRSIRYRLVVPQNGKIQGIELSDDDIEDTNDIIDDDIEDTNENNDEVENEEVEETNVAVENSEGEYEEYDEYEG